MLSTIIASDSIHPEANARSGDWVSQRIFGRPGMYEGHASVTVLRDGMVIAAAILHDWRPLDRTIEISLAGSGYWQSRRVINTIMRACFDIAGCEVLIARAGTERAKTMENARRLGFAETVIPNGKGRGKDEYVFTLTDEQWKAGRIYKAT